MRWNDKIQSEFNVVYFDFMFVLTIKLGIVMFYRLNFGLRKMLDSAYSIKKRWIRLIQSTILNLLESFEFSLIKNYNALFR